MELIEHLALIGPLSVCVALVVIGMLSRRLGRVTHSRPYYLGFFIAAALAAGAVVVRGVSMIGSVETAPDWPLVYNGLLAAGITLGLLVAWHYWSWLLAERD